MIDDTTVISEASDILTELPVISPRASNRVLRSMGPVPGLPNVQYKTLEYKNRTNN